MAETQVKIFKGDDLGKLEAEMNAWLKGPGKGVSVVRCDSAVHTVAVPVASTTKQKTKRIPVAILTLFYSKG